MGPLTHTMPKPLLPVADRPRFVAPGVVAARTVKAVQRLELIELAPDEDAEAYEALANVD